MDPVRPSILRRPIKQTHYKNNESVEQAFRQDQQRLQYLQQQKEAQNRHLLRSMHNALNPQEKRSILMEQRKQLDSIRNLRKAEKDKEMKEDQTNINVLNDLCRQDTEREKMRYDFVRSVSLANAKLMKERREQRQRDVLEEKSRDKQRMQNEDFSLRFGSSVY